MLYIKISLLFGGIDSLLFRHNHIIVVLLFSKNPLLYQHSFTVAFIALFHYYSFAAFIALFHYCFTADSISLFHYCFTGGFSTPSHHGSLSRRGKTHRAPITGIASPVVPVKLPEGPNSGNTGSLGRSGNPLRSFSVPEPPGFHKNLGTNTSTPKHIGNLIPPHCKLPTLNH